MNEIRLATLEDIPAITEIYNEAILNTANTFDTIAKTKDERLAWFQEHMPDYPILVAADGRQLLGFASISPWSPRPAYANTVSLSIYIHKAFRGRGVGKDLLKAMVMSTYDNGYHTIMGSIYAGNEVSLRLFESVGFQIVGLLKEVGYKFDEWLDVYLVQHIITSQNTGLKSD